MPTFSILFKSITLKHSIQSIAFKSLLKLAYFVSSFVFAHGSGGSEEAIWEGASSWLI